MTILAASPIESSSVTLGKKVVMNKFRSVSELSHSPTATTCSECPTLRIPKTQLCSLAPMPPTFCPQGLTVGSCERNLSILGTVAVWGRHNSSYGVGEPPSQTPAHTLPRVPEITSPTPRLTGSLRVSLPAFACGRERFCEESGGRLGPVTIKEPHTPKAQRIFQNCDETPRVGSGNTGQYMCGDWTYHLCVLSRDVPL